MLRANTRVFTQARIISDINPRQGAGKSWQLPKVLDASNALELRRQVEQSISLTT